MKSSTAELFERVIRRKNPQVSDTFIEWMKKELRLAESFESQLADLRRDEIEEARRHSAEMTDLHRRWVELQSVCPHEDVRRGTAECEPTCQVCGAEV